jgi:hypothetical protein
LPRPRAEECDGENVAFDTTASASLLELASAVFLRPARSHRRAVAHRAVVFSYAPDARLSSFGWRPALAMDIAAVVSQSDLVRFLHEHASELGPLRSATVDDLRLGAAPVRAVPADASALSAFQTLVRHDVSAVGITSPLGARCLPAASHMTHRTHPSRLTSLLVMCMTPAAPARRHAGGQPVRVRPALPAAAPVRPPGAAGGALRG